MRFRRYTLLATLVLIISVTLIQFLAPIIKTGEITIHPFGLSFGVPNRQKGLPKPLESEEKLAEVSDVLGANTLNFPAYTMYGAGFTGIPQSKLVKNKWDVLILGGLAQGGVLRELNQDGTIKIDGDGLTYVNIYNSDPSLSATVDIEFYQIDGEDLGTKKLTIDGKTISAKKGLSEPLWKLLQEACSNTPACDDDLVDDIGPEMPWVGFARVMNMQNLSSGGIFAVSETVSTNGYYAVGHDAMIPGIDPDVSNPSPVIVINVGFGETNNDFGLMDAEVTIGSLPVSTAYAWYIDVEAHNENGAPPTSIRITVDPTRSPYGISMLLSDLLEQGGITGPWRGWLKITAWQWQYSLPPFVTVNSINASGYVAWGQNGFVEDSYKDNVVYAVGGCNRFSIEDVQITIFNTSANNINYQIQECLNSDCSAPNEDSNNWTVFPQGEGSIGPRRFITVLSSGLDGCDQVNNWFNMIRVKATDKIIVLTRDYGVYDDNYPLTSAFGREHRHLLNENNSHSDVASNLYLPAQIADNRKDENNMPIEVILPDEIYSDEDTMGDWDSGTAGGNINHTTDDYFYYYNILNDVCDGKKFIKPGGAPQDRGCYTTSSLNYLDPSYQFSNNNLLPVCYPENSSSPCLSNNQKFKGYVKIETPSGGFAEYVNTLSFKVLLSDPWEQTEYNDVYSYDEVESPIPYDSNIDQWLTSPYYSSYAFSSYSTYDVGQSPPNKPSEKDWVITNYDVENDENLFDSMLSSLSAPPRVIEDIDDINGSGVYMLNTNSNNEQIIMEEVKDLAGSPSIIFIKHSTDNEDFTVEITPQIVNGGQDNELIKNNNGSIEIVPNSSGVLLFVVKGEVKIKSGENAFFFDGGDFIDAGIVATGKITIENDNFQMDPLCVKGFLFGGQGIEIQRNIGSAKSSVFPSVKIEWNPAYLVELRNYFKEGVENWSMPGLD